MSGENFMIYRFGRQTRIEFPTEWLDCVEQKTLCKVFDGGYDNFRYKITCIPNNNGYISVSVIANRRVDFSTRFLIKNTTVNTFVPAEPVEYIAAELSPFCPHIVGCDQLASRERLNIEGALVLPTVEITCISNFWLQSEIALPRPPSNARLFGDKDLVTLNLRDGYLDVNRFLLRSISERFRDELSYNTPDHAESFAIPDFRHEIVNRCVDIALGRRPSDCTLRQLLKMQRFSYEFQVIGLQYCLDTFLAKQLNIENFNSILANAIECQSTLLLKACYLLANRENIYNDCSFEEQGAMEYGLASFPADPEVNEASNVVRQEEESIEDRAAFLSTLPASIQLTVNVNQDQDHSTSFPAPLNPDFEFCVEHKVERVNDGRLKVSFFLYVDREIMTHYILKIEGEEHERSRCIMAHATQGNHLCTIPLGDQTTSFTVNYECEFEFAYEKICDLPHLPTNWALSLCDNRALDVGALETPTESEKMNRDLFCGISPLFCELFKDPKTTGVKLQNVKFTVLFRTVRYILGVKLNEITITEVLEILYFAHSYKIYGLKKHLEQWIDDNLTKEMLCDVAAYAEYSNNDRLKERCAQCYANVPSVAEQQKAIPGFTGLSREMMLFLQKRSVDILNEVGHEDEWI